MDSGELEHGAIVNIDQNVIPDQDQTENELKEEILMIRREPGELKYGVLQSEGKVLEITPLLYMMDGTMMALPPVQYHVPNWLLGFEDYHPQGMPYQMIFNGIRESIPGSNSRYNTQLGFMARILENQPGMVLDTIPTIPEDWAILFAQTVQTAIRENRE